MKTRMTLLPSVVSLCASVVMAQNWPTLIKAFRRNLEAYLPTSCKGPDKNAVVNYSADLHAPDGRLSFERAKSMGDIIRINTFVRLVHGGLKMETP